MFVDELHRVPAGVADLDEITFLKPFMAVNTLDNEPLRLFFFFLLLALGPVTSSFLFSTVSILSSECDKQLTACKVSYIESSSMHTFEALLISASATAIFMLKVPASFPDFETPPFAISYPDAWNKPGVKTMAKLLLSILLLELYLATFERTLTRHIKVAECKGGNNRVASNIAFNLFFGSGKEQHFKSNS